MEPYPFTTEEWDTCIKVLQLLKDAPFHNPDNQTLKTLITSIHKQAKKQVKTEVHLQKKAADEAAIRATTIVANAAASHTHYSHQDEAAAAQQVHFSRYCYVCGAAYNELHFFYHRLCPACAAINYEHRSYPHDLTGYRAVLTGGRVKIGYATALGLLRAGAQLILTTRFPAIAYEQLRKEPDFDAWQDRLTVYGLDLRNLKEADRFVAYCHTHLNGLEILINNAAQTIKYPAEYYAPLMDAEQRLLSASPAKLIANPYPPVDDAPLPSWPAGQVSTNRFGQPIDHREQNSWNAGVSEVGLEELLEVNLINHISPYCLISGLRPLMQQSTAAKRFIVNVTSSEGQFSYRNKTIHHPHTNMTKAALNMLTRTTGAELVQEGIYMNAVDVGWISTGAHEAKRERLFEDLKIPPLDPVDGAARILHVISAVKEGEESWFGVLLKDYVVVGW